MRMEENYEEFILKSHVLIKAEYVRETPNSDTKNEGSYW